MHISILDMQKKGFSLVPELYAQSVSLLAMKYVPDAHPRHDLHLCRKLTAGKISCLQVGHLRCHFGARFNLGSTRRESALRAPSMLFIVHCTTANTGKRQKNFSSILS